MLKVIQGHNQAMSRLFFQPKGWGCGVVRERLRLELSFFSRNISARTHCKCLCIQVYVEETKNFDVDLDTYFHAKNILKRKHVELKICLEFKVHPFSHNTSHVLFSYCICKYVPTNLSYIPTYLFRLKK